MVSSTILDNKIDLCILTETWLISDDVLIRTEPTPESFILKDCIRQDGRQGGGTGLLCKEMFKPNLISSDNKYSYEYSEYLVNINID